MNRKTEIIILAVFLGSGKSTLLKNYYEKKRITIGELQL
ncbi:CobW-like GTP-binding protein [Bacillus sp. JCM 19034]|nr:CobW-like GTP-binding protein [Bacillus sp. JCM 19034]